jgi:hypothetical protein
MSLNRREHARSAARRAEFLAGNLVHGLDQRRQPCHFAVSKAPLQRLLIHRLYLALNAAARLGAGTNPVAENLFPACRKKHRTNVICFTNGPIDPL